MKVKQIAWDKSGRGTRKEVGVNLGYIVNGTLKKKQALGVELTI